MTVTELVETIDSHLSSLAQEIAWLQAARDALADDPADTNPPATRQRRPARRQPSASQAAATPAGRRSTPTTPREPAAPRPTSSRPRRTRQPGPALSADVLLALFDGSVELTTATLAERAETDREQVLAVLRELEQTGKVRRVGQKRATRWRAFTDEDWIAERAAQLAAQSRAAA